VRPLGRGGGSGTVCDPAAVHELADETPDTFFAGRLATYRYLDMHQVVGQALAVFQDIVETPVGQPASSLVAR